MTNSPSTAQPADPKPEQGLHYSIAPKSAYSFALWYTIALALLLLVVYKVSRADRDLATSAEGWKCRTKTVLDAQKAESWFARYRGQDKKRGGSTEEHIKEVRKVANGGVEETKP